MYGWPLHLNMVVLVGDSCNHVCIQRPYASHCTAPVSKDWVFLHHKQRVIQNGPQTYMYVLK